MKRVALALMAAVVSVPAAASPHSDKVWRGIADAGEIGLPAVAIAATVAQKDRKGAIQLAETFALAVATTEALKYSIDEQRPNGGNHSFPSGHATAAFAGAGYIGHRYGWEYGAPAEAVALLVGYSRVHTRDHHWYDVVAGAAIGEGSAALFTRRLPEQFVIIPWGDSHGGGFAMTAGF